jgi:hypothetical protein
MLGDEELDRLLLELMSTDAANDWARRPNPSLDGLSPVESIRQDGPNAVRGILEAMADGTFT